MTFRDVPSLLKFEQYARVHAEDAIVMDCYRRIRDVITPVPRPPSGFDTSHNLVVDGLKASCEAVEKSTRFMWACAVSTGNVRPPMWDYLPDYEASLDYFVNLGDLELMAVTQRHRLSWEAAGR